MKKALSLFLAVAMACLLAACGQGSGTASTSGLPSSAASEPAPASSVGSDTPAAANTEPRTVTWMTVRSAWPAMDQIAEEYMALNPHITIEFDRISDRGSYTQKVQILAASNSLPDLFDAVGADIQMEIANAGTLVDIDELYADLGYDRMLPIGLEWGRLPNGKLYEMAWENNIEYFWYNKDMFNKAGISNPPETFDELLEASQKLSDAGFAVFSVWPGWMITRYLSFMPYRLTGNQYLTDLIDGKASMADEPGIKAAEFLQTLGTKYFQPGWSTTDYTGALQTFLSGNAAIYYIGTWQFGSFLDENGEVKDEYGFFYIPGIDGATTKKTDVYANAGTGTMINQGKFDDTLKDVVSYVLNEYPDKAFWDNNSMPAANFDASKGQLSSFWQHVIDDCNNMTGYAYTWDVKFSAAANETLSKEQTNLGMGAITPEEFAKRLDDALAAAR